MNIADNNNTNLVSYCGFYCGACPKYIKNQCEGCKGESVKCGIGYKACKVRTCCIEKQISTCAECNEYDSVKNCTIYNPFMIKVGQFLTRTRRRKGIEMIKKNGENEFLNFMMENKQVTIKI